MGLLIDRRFSANSANNTCGVVLLSNYCDGTVISIHRLSFIFTLIITGALDTSYMSSRSFLSCLPLNYDKEMLNEF